MENSKRQKSIKDNFKKLSRGLMQPSYSIAYEGYKSLYKIGTPVVDLLKEKLLEVDWSNARYKELSAYVSGIFSLLHDFDEKEADIIRKEILKKGCPRHIKAILNSVCEFTLSDYKKYELFNIDIFEHQQIKSNCDISLYLKKWLGNIPVKDLDEISRLYVVRKEEIEQISASGTYTSVLFKIALLWDNKFKENSIPFKLFSLLTEHTLYHEIGHHFHRHTTEQDRSDKEREAEYYAYQIMKEEHPYLYIFVKLLSKFGLKSGNNYYRWGL